MGKAATTILCALVISSFPLNSAGSADICTPVDAKAEIAKTLQSDAFATCKFDGLAKSFMLSARKQIGALRDLYAREVTSSGVATGDDEGESGEASMEADESGLTEKFPDFAAAASGIEEIEPVIAAEDWSLPSATVKLIAGRHDKLREATAALDEMSRNEFEAGLQLSFCWSTLERGRQRKIVDRLEECLDE